MKFFTSFLATMVFLLIGCGGKPKAEKRTENQAPEVTSSTPLPPVVHVVKKVERGHWKHFGVVGSVYRPDVKHGAIIGIEGGSMIFKTLSGPVWFADFEPNDNRDALDQRKVYLVRISSSLAKGCGYAMRDFASSPLQCVEEEKIVGWKEAKNFLEPKVTPNPQYWEVIEKFLRQRQWK